MYKAAKTVCLAYIYSYKAAFINVSLIMFAPGTSIFFTFILLLWYRKINEESLLLQLATR